MTITCVRSADRTQGAKWKSRLLAAEKEEEGAEDRCPNFEARYARHKKAAEIKPYYFDPKFNDWGMI